MVPRLHIKGKVADGQHCHSLLPYSRHDLNKFLFSGFPCLNGAFSKINPFSLNFLLKTFKNIYNFFLFMCLCECMPCVSGCLKKPEEGSGYSDPVVQTIVSSFTWALENKFGIPK